MPDQIQDPEAFAAWMDAITEPTFMTALGTVQTDAKGSKKLSPANLDPTQTRNEAEFSNPMLFMRLMFHFGDPTFQHALLQKLSQPQKYQRWMDAMANPLSVHFMPREMLARFAQGMTRPGPQAKEEWISLPARPANPGTPVPQRY